jgi:hypothetical protein
MKRRLIDNRTETTHEYFIENFHKKVKTIKSQETIIEGLNSSCFVEINPKYSQNGNEYLSIQLHIKDKKEEINREMSSILSFIQIDSLLRPERNSFLMKFVKFSAAIVAINGSLVNECSSEFLDKDLFKDGSVGSDSSIEEIFPTII